MEKLQFGCCESLDLKGLAVSLPVNRLNCGNGGGGDNLETWIRLSCALFGCWLQAIAVTTAVVVMVVVAASAHFTDNKIYLPVSVCVSVLKLWFVVWRVTDWLTPGGVDNRLEWGSRKLVCPTITTITTMVLHCLLRSVGRAVCALSTTVAASEDGASGGWYPFADIHSRIVGELTSLEREREREEARLLVNWKRDTVKGCNELLQRLQLLLLWFLFCKAAKLPSCCCCCWLAKLAAAAATQNIGAAGKRCC